MNILHLLARREWETVDGAYAPAGLTAEGFVHCSTATQLDGVAAERFAGRDDLLVLSIDPTRLGAELRWEDTHHDGRLFPHVYGPIEHHAVVAVEPYRARPRRRPA